LNLVGVSDNIFGRFYSWYDAVGLMLATGNVGPSLDTQNVNTYFTRDGALTWAMLKPGSHVYEFGDHGALMIMANGDDKTDTILFSVNQGIQWVECKFTDYAFNVDNIIVNNASGLGFYVHGSRVDPLTSGTQGVVVLVDFDNYHERTCGPDDFEVWTVEGYDKNLCVLGKKTGYTRRKQDANCFVGNDYTPQKTEIICPCTEDDYECDFDFVYDPATGKCEWAGDGEPQYGRVPPDCQDVYYPQSNGYRLVGGTACSLHMTGAVNKLGNAKACPGTGSSAGTIAVILVVLLLLGLMAGAGYAVYYYREPIMQKLGSFTASLKKEKDVFTIKDNSLLANEDDV